MTTLKTEELQPLTTISLHVQSIDFLVRGTSTFIFNAMSEKTRLQLLNPRPRKTMAERAGNLKHEPLTEYRATVYQTAPDDTSETRLIFPGVAFKRAMATAALDLPGMRKAQIGRLVRVRQENVPIWGIPQLGMDVVRSADMRRTPDIRTRAKLRNWCCRFTVEYVTPLIKAENIGQLLAASGVLVGVGDGRQEKGALSNGLFELVDLNDEATIKLMESAGREAQDRALADPAYYDVETERLMELYSAELTRQKSTPITRRRTNKTTEENVSHVTQ